jgi:hypothetical protein
MNAEDFKSLGDVVDVTLWDSSFIQFRDHLEFLALRPESRRRTRRCETFTLGNEAGEEVDMLRVFCEFGIRAVGTEINPKSDIAPADQRPSRAAATKQPAVPDDLVFLVEATLCVVIQLKRDFDQKDMDPFFANCCAHMAWPFWRQHVFDVVARSKLPQVPLPIFTPPMQPKKKSKSA